MTPQSGRPREYLRAGTVLAGRYEIRREIGRGGYSVVYAGRDQHIGQDVAIKVLVPPPATAEITRERMRREVQVVRELSHPNIVNVFDFVDDGEHSFIVMRLVDGLDLARQVTERGPLTVEAAVRLGDEISQALAVAHERGVLHRDVKPQNILIDRHGRALLTDFGSARVDQQHTLTQTGVIIGTPGYLSPNVLEGRRADARDDVYALGMTLCFALSGALPSRGNKAMNLRGQRPDVPPWLDDVIHQAIANDPLDRFHSAQRFGQALRDGVAGNSAAAALAAGVARCVVCGIPEPFGALVCEFCSSGPGAAADTLIVVRGEERSVARVPLAMSEVALGRLRATGRDAEAVPLRLSWTAIPVATWLLAALVCIAGFGAVSVGGVSGPWPTVVVLAVLLLSANQALRKPPVARRRTNSLPGPLHDEMLTTLAALSNGTARSLFGLLTAKLRAFADLSERHAPAPALVAGVHQLYAAACGIALDLDAADRVADGTVEARGAPAPQELDQFRIRLVNRLLLAADHLDRVCRSTLVWSETAAIDDLTRDLAREVEAMEIVNRLLAARA